MEMNAILSSSRGHRWDLKSSVICEGIWNPAKEKVAQERGRLQQKVTVLLRIKHPLLRVSNMCHTDRKTRVALLLHP